MSKLKLLTIFLLLLGASSCVKNNPTPSWIKIEKWKLEANPMLSGAEGELNQFFTDGWVYVDDKLIGVFELPAKIPVLVDGNRKVSVFPTVRNNGISATKKIYPFVEPYILNVSLEKGKTTTINPVTKYFSICNFKFVEDFESASMKFITDTLSTANIIQVAHTDPGRTGHCGYIALNQTDTMWLGNSHADMVLPKGSAEVYLEIEYKNTNRMITGVLGIKLPNTVTVNPNIQLNDQKEGSEVWKKMYIDLKEIVSSSTTADVFEIYLQAVLQKTKTSGKIYIDNIKVIHF